MKIPNGEKAVIDILKLREYCLNPSHPRGQHKAKVFKNVLNLTRQDVMILYRSLQTAAAEKDCFMAQSDMYGQRYTIDFTMDHLNKNAMVRSIWIIKTDEQIPRFVSCYIIKE